MNLEKRAQTMIDKESLNTVCDSLQDLIKKYSKNVTQGDLERATAATQAYKALRKVILFMEIKGDISNIIPHKENGTTGWLVTDSSNKIKYY